MAPMSEGLRRIAVLGTGIMGAPMARRLAEAGFTVSAWNRSRAKAEPLAADGVSITDTPAAACAGADVALLMLTDGPACDAVLHQGGVLAALRPGAVVLVMASIPPASARAQAAACAARGMFYVDAPVSGGERGAIAGTLAIMAGGEEAAIAALAPVFAPLGRATRIGPAGAGSLAKLANQLIVGVTIGAVAEALHLVAAGGSDPAAFRAAVAGGFADSNILRIHGERMISGDFRPGGTVAIQLKDMRSIRAEAEALGLDLPITRLVEQLYDALVAHGDGALDHSALWREIARRASPPRLGGD
ncbi:MAG: NAD(P)-dependent oxidoreductase [Alphaproteobacteria bacterium]|nr:NAD(P)-dependent oxidoreductase [Alphaproteobacteria bacterium]